MDNISDIKSGHVCSISNSNTAMAAMFCLVPWLSAATGKKLPASIPLEDIRNTYSPRTINTIINLLTVKTGWYAMTGKELTLTSQGAASQLVIGELAWLSFSLAAMLGGVRDMQGVIVASRLIGEVSTYTPYLAEIRSIVVGDGITQVIEFGQGAGEVICQVLESNPGIKGIAIDRDPAAAELTRRTAQKYGVTGRLSILSGDINDGLPKERLSDGNLLIIAGFVLHDFENIRLGVKSLSATLPTGTRLVLAELVADDADDPFAAAIVAYHARIGIEIPSTDEWADIFTAAGLRLESAVAEEVMPGARVFSLVKTKPSHRLIQAAGKVFPGHNTEVSVIAFGGGYPPHQGFTEAAFVDMYEFPDGVSGPHTHDRDETYVITGGTVRVFIDGEALELKGPVGVYIPASCIHYWKPIDVKKGDYIIGLFTKGEEK